VAVALCRAYNDYLYEEFLRVSPRFKGVAMVPLQDIGEAVLELRRAVTELGMVAAMLPTHGPMVRPLLGDSSYFPLYEEAQRLGCPLALHANVTNPSGIDVEAFEKFIESHTVIHPFGQMRQLTSLIFEGVLERFPTLTFASMEAGATWVPFFVDRMDEEFAKRGAVEAPLLKHPPSHYFRTGRVYVHFEPGEGLLPQTLDYIGEDYFVYATDYPHWDSEFPASVRQVQDRQDLSETAKVKILRDNALRLYHLD
jgi:predicted TIM-barrel fold metal-dependent hydrolase